MARRRKRLNPRRSGRVDRSASPRPLLFHLAAAALTDAGGVAAAMAPARTNGIWVAELRDEALALATCLQTRPREAQVALLSSLLDRLATMLSGIERYQRCDRPGRPAEPPAIWRCGSARLLDYGAVAGAENPLGRPVVFAPSLVNRPHVLDLTPHRSLLRWLAARGLRPLLLDWGSPQGEEQEFDLADYVRFRLELAVRAAADIAGCPVGLAGYCLGGSLSVALAARQTCPVERLALIGAPWRYGAVSGALDRLRTLGRMIGPERLGRYLDACQIAFGAVPVDLLQMMFAVLDPPLVGRKFRNFAQVAPGSGDEATFIALEDWLNDGVAMAVPAAKNLFIEWGLSDRAARGDWMVAGAPVRPADIKIPTMAVMSRGDRIAPLVSAEPLARDIPGAEARYTDAGHVGMVVGRRAEGDLWRPLLEFFGAS